MSDPAHPENEGKVFLYKFGKKIFDKVMEDEIQIFRDDELIDYYEKTRRVLDEMDGQISSMYFGNNVYTEEELSRIINQIEDVNNHYSLEHISYELDKRWNEKWDEEGEE